MKKLNYNILIFLTILSIFSFSYASEKKRDITLKNSSISFGNIQFLKNLSGEINLKKGGILFNNSFTLFEGKGSLIGEYKKKEKIDFKFKVNKMKFPPPMDGICTIFGEGNGKTSEFISNFKGTFENLGIFFKNSRSSTEIRIGKGKINSSNIHKKKTINVSIVFFGEKLKGKLNLIYNNLEKIVDNGSFEIFLKDIPLLNVDTNIINLGNRIDKLNIVGKIKKSIIILNIILKSQLLSLDGNIKVLKNKKIDGEIKINARKEAIGKKLNSPWFSYLIKSKLSILLELSGDLEKPKLKIIELK